MDEEIKDGDQANPPEPPELSPARGPVLTDDQKAIRFLIGFLGWWVVNVPLALMLEGGALLLFPAQIILLIVMALANRPVALGLVAAIGLNLLFSLLAGLFFNGVCFIPVTTPFNPF